LFYGAEGGGTREPKTPRWGESRLQATLGPVDYSIKFGFKYSTPKSRVVNENNVVLCPKCGSVSYLRLVKERLSKGPIRVLYVFRCPVCPYETTIGGVILERSNDYLVVKPFTFRLMDFRRLH